MRQRELTSAGIGELTLRGWHVAAGATGGGHRAGARTRGALRTLRHIGHGAGCARFCGVRARSPGTWSSGGSRANLDRFAHAVSDFCAFAGRAAKQHPGAPVYLLGHSMGGAIAFASALRCRTHCADWCYRRRLWHRVSSHPRCASPWPACYPQSHRMSAR